MEVISCLSPADARAADTTTTPPCQALRAWAWEACRLGTAGCSPERAPSTFGTANTEYRIRKGMWAALD